MKIGALKGGVRPLDVEFPGMEGLEDEKLHIEYRPGELTLEIADDMRAAAANNLEADAICLVLEKVLVSWDLEDDDGPLAVTKEGIKKIPLPALGAIFLAMMEDIRPNPQTGVDSNGGLQQEETSEKSLTGTS